MEDKILTAIASLTKKVDDLADQVTAHERKLRWITTAAVFVVGAVGGPNAAKYLAAVSGGAG